MMSSGGEPGGDDARRSDFEKDSAVTKNRKRQIGECPYCGKQAELTKDHIPPKTIFPQPIPNGIELVTVRCCEECNGGASGDDKYFAVVLSSSQAHSNPKAKVVWERLLDGGKRHPEEQGFWRGVAGNLKRRETHSPGGIYLGDLPVHTGYEERFYRVLERIIKGYFYKHHKRRLPDDYTVKIHESPPADFWRENQDLLNDLVANRCFQPMEGVFRLWNTCESKLSDVSIWYMILLEAKDFFCITVPKNGTDDISEYF